MEELTGVDMMKMTQRKLAIALMALMVVFAGCKSESPTTPPLGTGGTPSGGGGTPPPTNASISVAVSNANPLVNSNVTITATVTQNNQPVPNGTAVQFLTSLGTFTDTGAASTIKTTTNGVATAIVTSPTAGPDTITVTVNNTSKQTTITWSTQPVVPPPVSTTPTVTSITPNTGKPQGGDTLTITGTNFVGPIRVLFDFGNGTVKEGFVAGFTPTTITVVTPAIDLAAGTAQAADVIVLTQAGTAAEQRVVKAAGFTFTSATLVPLVRAVQPTSGPISGGTRVTIIGDNFQSPVQVFFNAAEAQVISVTFSQIIVMSPRASDTTPNGSGVVTGPVDIRVRNVSSNKEVTYSAGFRYIPKMQITTVGPTSGPFTGGTQITIDGSGFDDPLSVVIGSGPSGVAAQVIRVSATEVVAITGAFQPTGCGDVSGPITVTNTENGDQAQGPQFTYKVPKPLITAISPNPACLTCSVNVTVLGAFGFPRITIGGNIANINSQTTNPDGTVTFNVSMPPTVVLSTQACPSGGTTQIPTPFSVTYTSATTGCSDTSNNGLIVAPTPAPVLFVTPGAFTPFAATFVPGSAGPPIVPPSETPSGSQTVSVINTGVNCAGTPCPLTITAFTQVNGSGNGCADFAIVAPPPPVNLNACDALPIFVTYNGPTPPGVITDTCTFSVVTNAASNGTKTFLLVGNSK
jgi:IPT/TIG domain-containing protein